MKSNRQPVATPITKAAAGHVVYRRALALVAVFMVACGLLLTSCDNPSDYASSTPPESGLRIISLSPALTQILVDLGQSEYIVGVGQNDAAAPAAAKVVGNYQNINAEQIVALNPTLVVTMSGRDGPPARLKELAATRFILVNYPYPKSPTDVGNIIFRESELHMGVPMVPAAPAIKPSPSNPPGATPATPNAASQTATPVVNQDTGPSSLGALLDLLPQAMALKYTMLMRLGEISRLTSSKTDKQATPSVLMVIGTGPVMASGPGTVLDQLLILAGGSNAAAQTKTSAPTFDREKLLNLKPDMVLYFDPNGQPLAPINDEPRLASFRGLDIPAVKDNRIVIISNPQAMLPSSTLDKIAGLMAKAIHPELAKQIDETLKSSMVELDRRNDINALPADATLPATLKPGSVLDNANTTPTAPDASAAPATPAAPEKSATPAKPATDAPADTQPVVGK